ncbi:MAG: flap endonuclease-1 [Candidatus Altiarchaeales archaeon ex4484_96]|nr:MAG: flap endonuclease-1 [Candidatus Altiarchaeales archaeon ex4484_96]
MGVNFGDLLPSEAIDFKHLRRKTIAVDAMNCLYQFISTIRQPDGTPLMDSHGRTTSHLSGLFYRTIRLLDKEIKPVYVFDGKPPDLKKKEIGRRRELKHKAREEWMKALDEERMEDARKYAKRSSRLTREMIDESKKLLGYMGVPYVQAPAEGEAQCVRLCEGGDAWAVGSQDYDSLLLGSERLVRGLTLSGKFGLSLIRLDSVLSSLGISREQLVDMAILIGTDFNEGVRGIGPKKALKIVQGEGLHSLGLGEDFNEVRAIFLEPDVTGDYSVEWFSPDQDGLVSFMCDERGFSRERVLKGVDNLESALGELSQKDLSNWF